MSATPASKNFYQQIGVREIINARGYSTKLGGCALPLEVMDAMRAAADSCVLIEDLQEAAGEVIAEATGAESGIVTSGASAALTLAAAACLTGLDVAKMNQLPDTTGMNNEIVCHRAHRNDYDHALRLAGAKLVEAGFTYYTFANEVESAITSRTVAFFYLAGAPNGVLPLREFAGIAHRHGLPVIVDAAPELPPAKNLRAFLAEGADLVAFSGGKHLRGPQSTGILCGPKNLILAAALQHQDMDVFAESWPRRDLVKNGILQGPPHHGIGRGFKVGKEEIAGLMMALKLYAQRDFEAELKAWTSDMEIIASSLAGINGVSARVVFPQETGRLTPSVHIAIDADAARLTTWETINQLQEGTPPIGVFETLAPLGVITIYPEGLRPGEAAVVAKQLREILLSRG